MLNHDQMHDECMTNMSVYKREKDMIHLYTYAKSNLLEADPAHEVLSTHIESPENSGHQRFFRLALEHTLRLHNSIPQRLQHKYRARL